MDNADRFKEVSQKISDLSSKKIRLEERLKAEKAQLEKLLKEVTDKGYDPKKLTEIRKEKEIELENQFKMLETELKDLTQKISVMEA